MTHIAVLGSTNMDLVAYVEKAPQRGETVTGREFRTIPGGKGANQAIAAARSRRHRVDDRRGRQRPLRHPTPLHP